MNKPYVIASPLYDPTSGGIKVMHGLYGWLLAKGFPAYLNQQVIDVDTVGVYPEIYQGNPLKAKKSIRYILQTPNMMGGYDANGKVFAGPTTNELKNDPQYKDDEIYVFSKVYDTWDSDDDHILFLPIIDLYNFRDYGRRRTKKAFYVGKGINGHKHPKDAIELQREGDQEKLATFLNECEVLYVYDRLSAIMECARLCGCRVVYLGELPKEKIEIYEPGMNGLGYREETPLNASLFRLHYQELIYQFSQKLDRFIDHTQR